ncbi:hypothetical protein AB0C34_17060 [Nocardia sp. NPDC049220]|uniref:hypothetical protein n=1 Tax=Nocardia sp. NPDC049220 TaxID=3155273 RepID=UPI0033D31870
MTTTYAPDTAARIMEHLDTHPLPGVTTVGVLDCARPDPADIGGWADDNAADRPDPQYIDTAILHLNIGRLTLNATTSAVRWWLEVERESEFGSETLQPAGEGVLDGDIAPVIDAIRAATSDTDQ